jgi:uncharacterized protein
MKSTYSVLLMMMLLLACSSACTRNFEQTGPEKPSGAVSYDTITALKYGADEYGMKKYVIAFLYRGNNISLDSAQRAELQYEHLKNINKMSEEGKLILAGPFFGNGELRGIYIFNVSSISEAEELTNTDPAIQAGSLKMELMEWYGSAALMAVNDIHKTLEKNKMVK